MIQVRVPSWDATECTNRKRDRRSRASFPVAWCGCFKTEIEPSESWFTNAQKSQTDGASFWGWICIMAFHLQNRLERFICRIVFGFRHEQMCSCACWQDNAEIMFQSPHNCLCLAHIQVVKARTYVHAPKNLSGMRIYHFQSCVLYENAGACRYIIKLFKILPRWDSTISSAVCAIWTCRASNCRVCLCSFNLARFSTLPTKALLLSSLAVSSRTACSNHILETLNPSPSTKSCQHVQTGSTSEWSMSKTRGDFKNIMRAHRTLKTTLPKHRCRSSSKTEAVELS